MSDQMAERTGDLIREAAGGPLTAGELAAELEKTIERLAPEWPAQNPDLHERLVDALADSPEQVLRLMTYEEFLEWGLQEGIHAEWVDGKVFVMSPISWRHQQLMQFLFLLLKQFVTEHDLGELALPPFQMRLTVPPRGREPDLFFIAKEHLGRIRPTYLDGPADLAVEIVSPESSRRDRETKLREYEMAGVPEYWIIDPEREEALFYQHHEGRYQLVLSGRSGRYHSAMLPGFWIEVEWLWQEPLPRIDAIRQQSRG